MAPSTFKQKKDPTKELHQLLEENEIIQIQDEFNKEEHKRMDRTRLKEVLWKCAMIEYSDTDFEIKFLRMNAARYLRTKKKRCVIFNKIFQQRLCYLGRIYFVFNSII